MGGVGTRANGSEGYIGRIVFRLGGFSHLKERTTFQAGLWGAEKSHCFKDGVSLTCEKHYKVRKGDWHWKPDILFNLESSLDKHKVRKQN